MSIVCQIRMLWCSVCVWGGMQGVIKIRLVDPGFFFLKNPLQIYRDGKKCEDVPTDLSLRYSGTVGIPLSLSLSLSLSHFFFGVA